MSFIEKLDEKSLAVFNQASNKNSSSQCMFFLNAFWDEYGNQAEFIYAVANQIFRMSDMKSKGIMYVHLYEEGHDLDFDMGIYLFEQLCKFWDDPKHEWFRPSGLSKWSEQHANFKELYAKSQPVMMTSIARKKELRERVDVNFDGRISMLEYLLYQYGASPKSLIERSMASADMPAELRAALEALAEVQKRANDYEAEKHRLEEESSKGTGVKALGAKNLLAQLTSSPLWENINRALITAEAKVRICQRKFGKGGSEVDTSAVGNPMRNEGTLWWMERELQEKKEKYGKK